MKEYYVYIITNKSHTVLYIGVTNNLARRLSEHKNKLIEGFTAKYNISILLYFEACSDIKEAIQREKQLKRWSRTKKMDLIKGTNPSLDEIVV